MAIRICKKCLIYESADEDLKSIIERHIDSIPEDARTKEEDYTYRMGVCKECDKLFEGMCRGCGCYVEVRGAQQAQGCPYGKWEY